MAPTIPRRLPGIRFETQAPPPVEVLPRMDVAGFVGFAAAGPIGVPVPVEDAAAFADVFGADAPLAWDDVRREPVDAYLAPAVRAFFRNGGERCWVVRVADECYAAADRFALPGVAALGVDGGLGPAVLQARARGSWADALRVSASLEPLPLRADVLALDAPSLRVVVAPAELTRGDLIRLAFPGSPWSLLMVADAIAPSASAAAAPTLDGAALEQLDVQGGALLWVSVAEPAPGAHGAATYLDAHGGSRTATATVELASPPEGDGVTRLTLDAEPSTAPPPGALVRARLDDQVLFVDVAGVEATTAGGGVALVGSAFAVADRPPSLLPAPESYAERLTLRLLVEGGDRPAVLGGLGFAPEHPRFVGALPVDEALYDPEAKVAPAVASMAAQPRFPLAGPRWLPALYLPLGASILPGPVVGALCPPGPDRVRDGLAGDLGTLFVDQDLAGTGAARLLEEGDWIRDQSPAPRRLAGIHALLDNDEVTLMAVPDAVQRGWGPGPDADVTEPAPPPPATEPDWSRFLDCATHVPASPHLDLRGDPASGFFALGWTATDVAGADYELQEAQDPQLATADTLYAGPARSFDVYGRPRGAPLYYQVRARAGDAVSGWSNRLVVSTARETRWFQLAPEQYAADALLAVQLALLRMCAARGDMLALLALPEHYRERAAVAHVRALKGLARPLGSEPDPIFSHGALYHPWLDASEPAQPTAFVRMPPDGAAAGVAAGRAAGRGAWIAPANQPLRDVVALAPSIPAAAYQALQDAQLNLVRHEPSGFVWLAADTLSDADELRPIGVRRLLALLRRVALRDGSALAFEPNDGAVRRTAQRSFETLLERMFELGAFAGRSPAEGFRVDTPVAPADLDEGRLVVELRVAPSRPLAYLIVRIVRTGAGALLVEERGS